MSRMKNMILYDILKVGPGFAKRAIGITTVEIVTGFFLSFLIEANLGTDPATFMNVNIAGSIHLSFGTWQLLFNLVLILIDILFTGFQYVGVGTIANMVLIGYSADFFRWLWGRTLKAGIFANYPARAIFFLIGLLGFIVCVSIYMNYDMGMAPYDATPYIIRDKLKKVPFTVVRICWDFAVIGIGILFGGFPPVGTIILALALGPTVSFVGGLMKKARGAGR